MWPVRHPWRRKQYHGLQTVPTWVSLALADGFRHTLAPLSCRFLDLHSGLQNYAVYGIPEMVCFLFLPMPTNKGVPPKQRHTHMGQVGPKQRFPSGEAWPAWEAQSQAGFGVWGFLAHRVDRDSVFTPCYICGFTMCSELIDVLFDVFVCCVFVFVWCCCFRFFLQLRRFTQQVWDLN